MAELTLRRTRLHAATRELTREVRVHPEQMIQPLFVVEGLKDREVVPGLQGVWRDTTDTLLRQVEADMNAGVRKFLLFGVPRHKAETQFEHAFTAAQISALKDTFGADLWLAVDTCLCSATRHGHCGVLNAAGDYVDNAASVAALAAAAGMYAASGADCVAPSDMMDGRVAAIRAVIDQQGDDRTMIMSYSAKFHSGLYGPFRIAADSTPAAVTLRDRASYQIDPGRPRDALRSAQRDAAEGADILMVKPGLPYLDVLQDLSRAIPLPWAVYQTSGECAGLDALDRAKLGERSRLYPESWTAFARAGAHMIISYAARDAHGWLAS